MPLFESFGMLSLDRDKVFVCFVPLFFLMEGMKSRYLSPTYYSSYSSSFMYFIRALSFSYRLFLTYPYISFVVYCFCVQVPFHSRYVITLSSLSLFAFSPFLFSIVLLLFGCHSFLIIVSPIFLLQIA